MRGAAVWSNIAVPVMAPVGWARSDLDGGLRELERIRRAVDAASAVLIGALGTSGRDTAAAIVRATGSSTRRAREQAKMAAVAETVAGAAEALERGEVSAEHLSSLARIGDVSGAAELLSLAAVQSPEEFAVTVTRFELDRDGASIRDRQRVARSVRFFAAEEGCVGVRAVLTPLEGAELKAKLSQIVDAAWRRKHSERASVSSGHGGRPLHSRLADALMALVRGEPGTVLGAKPSIVVTVNAETLNADLAGTGLGCGPVSLADAAELSARADVYGAVRDASGTILNFGRSRRLATALQRLAVVVRDGGRCAIDGCDASHERCHVHHVVEFERGGMTDLAGLALVCGAHHPHLHANGLRLIRDGTRWRVAPAEACFADTG